MKPKIAFVDHSFHKKTRSSDFFRKIISNHFVVNNFWDDYWRGGKRVSIDILNHYKYIIFAQSINEYRDLKKIKGEIIWLPMYDSETTQRLRLDRSLYYKLLARVPIKAICFSKKLYNRFVKLGIKSLLVQYYFNPKDFKKITDYRTRRVFFWDRGDISFEMIKKIIGNQKIDRFILKIDYDPGRKNKMPSEEDIKKYNLEIIKGTISREKYLKLLSQANIFISPRQKEGIGMSFLEAMTLGQCVIAHNDSTMNEYIKNGINGILVDDWNKPVNLIDFEKMGRKAREACERGYKKWLLSQDKIIRFILSKDRNKKREKDRGLYFVWLMLDKLYKIIMPLYQFLRNLNGKI